MFRNYLLIAFRSFKKSKAYSFLNIFGLTLGITCSVIIFLYVFDELTYDSNHSRLKEIYRLNGTYHLPNNGGREDYALCGPLVGEAIVNDFPEVEQLVRMTRMKNEVLEREGDDQKFYEEIFAADSTIFKMFDFPFIAGDPNTALEKPENIVLSERMAIKYFNSTDIIGKTLHLSDRNKDVMIAGVYKTPPTNTQFKFDFILSLEGFKTITQNNMASWWAYGFYNYLILKPGSNAKELEEKVKFISRRYIADQEDGSGYKQEYSLTPLADVHLKSSLRNELEVNNKQSYVYTFLMIGIFTLVIACINFMNLATARSAMRAKEIGLRKVVGAVRPQLVGQFLSESFLMTAFAVILSIGLVALLLPSVNEFTGKQLQLLTNTNAWLILLSILVFVALLAGSYPSLFLSAFRPHETLKGNFKTSSKGNGLRKTLVVFQFSISIFLIAGTGVVYQHIQYLRNIDLGFTKERIVFIPTRSIQNSAKDFAVLKDELKKVSGVTDVTLSSRVPGTELGNSVVRLGWDETAAWNDMRFLTADEDFFATYKLSMKEGRWFDKEIPNDATAAYVVNESGVKRLGWESAEDAIGKKVSMMGRNGEIVGVVKDFHFMASNSPIEPFIIRMNMNFSVGYLSAKLSGANLTETMRQIENTFQQTLPNRIFEYQFLEQDFDKQYKAEDQFVTIFSFFSFIAISIACLGLYGLSMFMAELKLKEIGIRKVLGATEKSLVTLFVKDFTILVLISCVIAIPVSYWAMEKWLSSFPLRQAINPMLLLTTALIGIVIAVLTVSIQSYKAARSNPIDSIRES